MLKAQIVKGLVTGLAICSGSIVSILFVHYYLSSASAPEINAELIKVCNEVNKNCPITIDKFTRLDTTMTVDHKLIYVYTITGMTDVDAVKLKDNLKLHTVEMTHSLDETKNLLDRGITLEYKYSNAQGKALFEFEVAK